MSPDCAERFFAPRARTPELTDRADTEGFVPAREVRRRFLLFFLPGVLQLVLVFATLPLTTLVLGPADFAAFGLIVSFAALVMSLSQVGSGYLLSQRFRTSSKQGRAILVTTMAALVLTASVALAAIFVAAFVLLRGSSSVTAGITVTMVLLVAVESIGSSMYVLVGGIAKLGAAPGHYSLVAMFKSITAAGATLAALFLFDMKGVALFVGDAAGGTAALVGSLAMLSRYFGRIDRGAIKDALWVGGWSTMALLALQARQIIERVLLSRYVGLYDLGLYVHAQQYQSLATLATQPVQSAVTPVLLDEAKEPAGSFARTARVSNVLFLGVTMFGVAAALFGRPIIGLLTHGKFDAAAPFVALLVGAVLVQLSGRPQLAHLLANGRGRYLSLCNVLAATGAVLTLLALVNFFGLLAAVLGIYVQYLLFRLATGIDPFSTARPPFQDGWVVVGLSAIMAAVAGVEHFQPDLLTSAMVFTVFLAMAAIFARAIFRDVVLQIGDHLGHRGRVATRGPLESQVPRTVR
jgi:O-antigen/teichoic acid export membrane protein